MHINCKFSTSVVLQTNNSSNNNKIRILNEKWASHRKAPIKITATTSTTKKSNLFYQLMIIFFSFFFQLAIAMVMQKNVVSIWNCTSCPDVYRAVYVWNVVTLQLVVIVIFAKRATIVIHLSRYHIVKYANVSWCYNINCMCIHVHVVCMWVVMLL